MNYLFFFLIALSIIIGIINGTLDNVVNSMLTGCETAVKIALSLIGIMAFWLGMMKIAEKSGLVKILSKIIHPLTKPLFKDLNKENNALGDITMSLSANALGLTNAATPIGLKVMRELQEENPNKDTASDSMCMFLGMNTAGFQLIPATVIAVLISVGSKNPTEIIAPAVISTTCSCISAIVIDYFIRRKR